MDFSFLRVLLITPVALFGAATPDAFHWTGKIPAGQLIEIRGINGNIHAQPASGESADVTAKKTSDARDPADLQLKVMEHDGGVIICAVSPSSGGDCMDSATTPNVKTTVDFTVSVPAGVRFVARTVNGTVEAKSLKSDTEAHTVNGNLVLSTSGTAQGETVNGSITASVGSIKSPAKFSTVNGGITLEVPPCASALVHAKTTNGPIRSDFRLSVRGTSPTKHMDGAIGGGGPELRIATVNGSIRLRRTRQTSGYHNPRRPDA